MNRLVSVGVSVCLSLSLSVSLPLVSAAAASPAGNRREESGAEKEGVEPSSWVLVLAAERCYFVLVLARGAKAATASSSCRDLLGSGTLLLLRHYQWLVVLLGALLGLASCLQVCFFVLFLACGHGFFFQARLWFAAFGLPSRPISMHIEAPQLEPQGRE